MTDKDKDRIKCAIRHIKSSLDVDTWAMEIAVDAMQRMMNADGDLISRGAAIKALDAEFRCTDNSDDWNGLKTAMLIIEELPSVPSDMTIAYLKWVEDGKDAVRKTGHWTDDNACPFCGFQPWYERDIHTLSYCPNCGAEMRGGEDG